MKGSYIAYIVLAMIAIVGIQGGFNPPVDNVGEQFTLPITRHSDGHYYDANGRLVS